MKRASTSELDRSQMGQQRLSPMMCGLMACIVGIILNGCGGPCGKPEIFTLQSTTVVYFGMFQENSYWVYQCVEDSSIIDTLTLRNRRHRIEILESEVKCKPNHAEQLTYTLEGSVQMDTLGVWLSSRRSDSFSIGGTFLNNVLTLNGSVDGVSNWFYVSDHWNDEFTFHETLDIGGLIYEGVVQMKKPWSTSFPERVPTFWLARGVGIVQFEQYNELLGERRTFQLKAYHIH
jgi:hypothetical protein